MYMKEVGIVHVLIFYFIGLLFSWFVFVNILIIREHNKIGYRSVWGHV
jgi:hypothetical protein